MSESKAKKDGSLSILAGMLFLLVTLVGWFIFWRMGFSVFNEGAGITAYTAIASTVATWLLAYLILKVIGVGYALVATSFSGVVCYLSAELLEMAGLLSVLSVFLLPSLIGVRLLVR